MYLIGWRFEVDEDRGPIAEIDAGPPLPTVSPSRVVMRKGYPQSDDVDCGAIFSRRARVMKTVPIFLWGSFRAVLKVALKEI